MTNKISESGSSIAAFNVDLIRDMTSTTSFQLSRVLEGDDMATEGMLIKTNWNQEKERSEIV